MISTLEEHQKFMLARDMAWKKYNECCIDLSELRRFSSEEQYEPVIREAELDVEIWNYLFTLLEKQIPPHDGDTTNCG